MALRNCKQLDVLFERPEYPKREVWTVLSAQSERFGGLE